MNAPRASITPRDTTSTPTWRTWLVIGAAGFGGPAAQIALLHREVVERHRWLDEEEFLAAMRVCMLLPGPEAQQLATYAGWRLGGWRGGLLAGGLFILPGAILVTLLAWLHVVGEKLPPVAAAFAGTRPAVVALIALAAWRIGKRSITTGATAAIAAAAAVALVFGAPFPLVILTAGVVGILSPLPLTAPTSPVAIARRERERTPEGAERSGRSPLRPALTVILVATTLWMASFAAAGLLTRGREIASLFTETTLLSFGGAYAVVPWALDKSVARGWIDPAEQFDALAMGEATPGPLILVVTFLGFLAGYRQDPSAAAVAGLWGAGIATWFAFLPSFAMILAVAPLVWRVRTSSRWGNALAAVGGVVVAAIVLLGVRLGVEAFLPDGRLDVAASILAALAVAALLKGWASAPMVVILTAGIGVLRMVLV